MRTRVLPHSDLKVSQLAYGCMRLAGTWVPAEVTPEKEAHGRAAVQAAIEAGFTFFDHADVYCENRCEAIFGQVLKESRHLRKDLVIASKCGVRFDVTPMQYDFSESYIIESCERSLLNLGIETLDLYQLHRPDLLMNPHEVASAFTKLQAAGKVRYFGVSNFLPSTLDALQAFLPQKLIVHQVKMNLRELAPIYDGVLDQCLRAEIAPVVYSPIAGGELGDDATASDSVHAAILDTLDRLAEKYSATRNQIALAWLTKHPSGIIPIIGSTNPARITEMAKAGDLEIEREEWYALTVAARGKPLP